MIPVGYLYKTVAARPDWLEADKVEDVYSVSTCVSSAFTDYVCFWRHNGYWLFDSPEIMRDIAKANGVDLSEATLFYFEAFEEEFDEGSRSWSSFYPEPGLPTEIVVPPAAHLEGFDVATFFARAGPECSPLSCNSMASEIKTNRHCLFDSLDAARRAIETDGFKDCEPGPLRIFAVYTIDRA